MSASLFPKRLTSVTISTETSLPVKHRICLKYHPRLTIFPPATMLFQVTVANLSSRWSLCRETYFLMVNILVQNEIEKRCYKVNTNMELFHFISSSELSIWLYHHTQNIYCRLAPSVSLGICWPLRQLWWNLWQGDFVNFPNLVIWWGLWLAVYNLRFELNLPVRMSSLIFNLPG